MADNYFFRKPFAIEGDTQEVPVDLQPTGQVSFTTGWGFDYERDPETDPNAKDVDRPSMNWIIGAITAVLRQYQVSGTFYFITPEMNGGNPFPYAKSARCLYEGEMYESLVNNNTSVPTDITKWAKVGVEHLVPITRKIITTGALTGGGPLNADLTLNVTIPPSVPPTRQVKTAAPLAGGGPLSSDLNLDIQPGADGTVLTSSAGKTEWQPPAEKYILCEFYSFRHPLLKPGFMPAQGGLLENAAELYPEAWAYLQTPEGQLLCKTEAEWQAMTTAIWHTNADGTTVGWNGIGGAPFYAPNFETGALRLPDLRGMYAEAAGFDGLGVGGVHGDAIRNFAGEYARESTCGVVISGGSYTSIMSGPYAPGRQIAQVMGGLSNSNGYSLIFDPSRAAPTAAKNQVRAWGSLPCVYLGQPAG